MGDDLGLRQDACHRRSDEFPDAAPTSCSMALDDAAATMTNEATAASSTRSGVVHHPPSGETEKSFFSFCRWSKGPPQILLLIFFFAIASGCTSSVIPEVISDRYARLLHGYDDEAKCYELTEVNQACREGSDDAQTSAAFEAAVSSVFQFITGALVGSMSDRTGRRPFLIMAVVLCSLSPIVLVLLQLFSWMHPAVYYVSDSSTGLVSIIAMAYATLSDSVPPSWRAPFNGILMSALYVGISAAPSLALILNHMQLSTLSAGVFVLSVVLIVCGMPETLQMADRFQGRDTSSVLEPSPGLTENVVPLLADGHEEQETAVVREDVSSERRPSSAPRFRNPEPAGTTTATCNIQSSCVSCLYTTVTRPFREMTILGRNRYFQMLSVVAFCSALVLRADLTLMLYYLEDRLHFTEGDIATVFLLQGSLGVLVQGCLLRTLITRLGEDGTLTLAFIAGTIKFLIFAVASDKRIIFMSLPISSLMSLAFPTIAAMKSNNASPQEQGRIQGALFSLTAIADAVGPLLFQAVNHYARNSAVPGAMWLVAVLMEGVAAVFAFWLPAPPYQMNRTPEPPIGGDNAATTTPFMALPAEDGVDCAPLEPLEGSPDATA